MSRIIALYLPQYHRIKENDEWWGIGFTEWVNVAKARVLFKGHHQPNIPADLGFYDLTNPDIRKKQADLAREAGVEGFCYWHYWFGNGKQLLEKPFNDVVKSGSPDFPFCLGWANHSWYKKSWDPHSKGKDILLIEQIYPGEEEHREHFFALLDAFKDERYLKVNDKLFFLIYQPLAIPNVEKFISLWRKLARENGLNDFYFVGQQYEGKNTEEILNAGFDAISNRSLLKIHGRKSKVEKAFELFKCKVLKRPRTYKYAKAMNFFNDHRAKELYMIPNIYPGWDHTPRSKHNGAVLIDGSPDIFYAHAKNALDLVEDKPEENQLLLLTSWNEWGEGNYMEPDRKFGKGYIQALRRAVDEHKLK